MSNRTSRTNSRAKGGPDFELVSKTAIQQLTSLQARIQFARGVQLMEEALDGCAGNVKLSLLGDTIPVEGLMSVDIEWNEVHEPECFHFNFAPSAAEAEAQ